MGKLKEVFSKKLEKGKKVLAKLKRGYLQQKMYVQYYEDCPVDEYAILLESQQGATLERDISELAANLCARACYDKYKIYVAASARTKKNKKRFFKNNKMKRVKVLSTESFAYYKVLATAKYLVSDGELSPVYMKRKEQRYLNIWNYAAPRIGGRYAKSNYGKIGNLQRSYFAADYLLYSGEHMMKRVCEDYMLSNIATGTAVLCGHPRNGILFNEEERCRVRTECGMDGFETFFYFPTARSYKQEAARMLHKEQMLRYLWELNKELADGQKIYVKLPDYIAASADWDGMEKIFPMPQGYGIYDILNAVDGLITDYSGMLFDYAGTGRKIVLFTFDGETYLKNNNFSISWEELPFPQVRTVQELARVLKEEKSYDDSAFMEQFCKYENKEAADMVCRLLLFDELGSKMEQRKLPDNGKKNVVMFAGDFKKNGITTALLNILNMTDRELCNYIILYKIETIQDRQDCLKQLPEHVAQMGFRYVKNLSLRDAMALKKKKCTKEKRMEIYHRQAKNEVTRLFTGCRVDKVIHFNGYVNDMILMFEEMPCSRTIYAHNDMDQEIRTKRNVNRDILGEAYCKYDSVAVVTPDLIPITKQLAAAYSKEAKPNIIVAKNLINSNYVEQQAQLALTFDAKTTMNKSQAEVVKLLHSDKKKFITIGRFSAEKGHDRLIAAFEKLHEKQPDTCLIILGGYGVLYNATVRLAASSAAADSIVIMRYMPNPFPLLKLCDYFVLPSLYEGFGLVLAEADILGLKCVATDIVGPKLFMEQYGGYLVENSDEGVLAGLQDCMTEKVPQRLAIDYKAYDAEAVHVFETQVAQVRL